MEHLKQTLDRLYNDPSSPSAFAGVERLWEAAKEELGPNVKKKDIARYLEGHRTYSLMRPRRVRFPRAKTVAAGFMTDVQADLADLQSLAKHNKGHRYLLVAVDVLSKRIFVVPLKTKGSEDMLEAFKILISKMPMAPHRIFSDNGKEFKNKLLNDYFKKEEIEKYESKSTSVKASIAERAIRTIKQRLYRYFSQKQTMVWVDIIEKIIDGINRSKSRVHGLRPIDVNFKNAQQIWKKIYGNLLSAKQRKVKSKFKEGDFVRMSRDKGIFEKGYLPNYGDEILEIDKVKNRSRPVRYKLRDETGDKFLGTFYREELAPVRKDEETEYRVRVIRERKKGGEKELLVEYIGYPGQYWIPASDLVV